MHEVEQLGVGLTRLAMAEAALAFFIADEVDAIEIPLLLYGDGNDEQRPK